MLIFVTGPHWLRLQRHSFCVLHQLYHLRDPSKHVLQVARARLVHPWNLSGFWYLLDRYWFRQGLQPNVRRPIRAWRLRGWYASWNRLLPLSLV